MFNDGQYVERARAGEFKTVLWVEKHPSPPRANEPYCTISQMIAYLDKDGKRVALVHQYLRPDGRIGASGRPDPKQLLQGGALYVAE
jgi:hypothetical protein